MHLNKNCTDVGSKKGLYSRHFNEQTDCKETATNCKLFKF